MYDGEQGILLEPMQENWAYSRVGLGYPRDISHSCGDISVLLDVLGISGGISEVQAANQGSLPV